MDIDQLHIIHSGLSMALNEELDQYPNSMIGKVFLDKVYSIKHPLSGVKGIDLTSPPKLKHLCIVTNAGDIPSICGQRQY